ncbi:MAG: ribokinase [Sedimentisphaerales bacterium]|nr:ribokinase [Sedimentisphaerales bacterium]
MAKRGSGMKPKIVIVGSSNTDMIVKVDRIPRPGETVLGGRFITAPGGKGANQAVAAARAGANVTFVARLGSDMFGQEALAGFIRDGIDTQFVILDESEPSGVASIVVDRHGENSIAVAPGANARLCPEDIMAARSAFESAAMVLLQLEIPLDTVQAACHMAKEQGVPILLNPAPAQDLSEVLLSCVSILTPNEIEASLLSGIRVTDEPTAEKAAAQLAGHGIPTVLITLGARGVFVHSDEYTGMISSFEVEPVDTTAAGDVFNGALATALADGASLPEAARFANAAAAISVTLLGAQTSAPTRKVIEDFLAGDN